MHATRAPTCRAACHTQKPCCKNRQAPWVEGTVREGWAGLQQPAAAAAPCECACGSECPCMPRSNACYAWVHACRARS